MKVKYWCSNMRGGVAAEERGDDAEYHAKYELPLETGAMRYRFPRAAVLCGGGQGKRAVAAG